MDNLVFNLGMIEMLSYWKSTCSPEIIIEADFLAPAQIDWWRDSVLNGMGQYFFENKIDFTKKDFLKITSKIDHPEKSTIVRISGRSFSDKEFLVPVGGGKDSAVALEILKTAKKKITCFILNPNQAALAVIKIADCGQPIIVKRIIDPLLLKLNKQGFLNGHTPFSAYLAFLSVLLAVVFGKKYIALANERSANEGNVRYLGKEINHQYSKSFEFEQKFRAYCRKYLAKDIEYFSLLRPLYELQIAKIFSRYPKYFKAFSSCNQYQAGKSKGKKWCGQCPKCLFVFTCLRSFIEENQLVKIFGKNLFADKKLLPMMEQLTGKRGFKPFECVGTARETRAALYGGKKIIKILHSWESRHNLSLGLKNIVKTTFHKSAVL